MNDISEAATTDPFQVLGLSKDAGEAEVRSRYLELVKRFPPEREPDRFREIHAAFQAAQDPLVMARHLLELPDDSSPPRWSDVIEQQKSSPPELNVSFLLSLGNHPDDGNNQSSDNNNT